MHTNCRSELLTRGEFRVAFVLYADTLLSINQIAPLLDRTYKTVFEAINDVEVAFACGFPTVWERVDYTINGPTQVDETQRSVRASRAKTHRGTDCSAAGRPRADGHGGAVNR